jgi:hypothetical protein
MLLAAALTFAGYRFFPPRFHLSRAELAFHDESYSVEFTATNHGDAPVAKLLRVRVFSALPGTKYRRPVQRQLEHRDLPVRLAPSESRRIRCEFETPASDVPNLAEIEVVSNAQ